MSVPEPAEPGATSYSTAYVARRLGVSVPTVQRWVDAGHLKAWKTLGGHRRIDAASAETFFRSQASFGQAPAAPPMPERAEVAGTLRVVVVDDNPSDRDLLTAMVEAALPGCQVTAAENGFQGLVEIGRIAPEVVVTDILMPKMDGLEMLDQLAAHCAVRPRVLVAATSESPAELARRGPLPPGVHYARKPLDADGFLALLRGAVATSGE